MKHIKKFENYKVNESAFDIWGTIVVAGILAKPLLRWLGKGTINKLSTGEFNNSIRGLKDLSANYVVFKQVDDDIYFYIDTSVRGNSPRFDVDNPNDYTFKFTSENEFVIVPTGKVIGRLNDEDRELFLKVLTNYEKGNFAKYESMLNEGIGTIAFFGTLLVLPLFIKKMKNTLSCKLDQTIKNIFDNLYQNSVGDVKIKGDGESLHILVTTKGAVDTGNMETEFYITKDNRVLVNSAGKFFGNYFKGDKNIEFKLQKPGYIPEYTKELCTITDEERKQLMEVILNKTELE